MKKKFYFFLFILILHKADAQVPEEALRLSWFPQTGTARSMATGGAMASLGGDATASFVNPAGLAFFKTSDFMISPGMQFGKGQTRFRGTSQNVENKNFLVFGTSGIVVGGFGDGGRNSLSLTVTKRADFHQALSYSGYNDYSSFAEPLADEFAASGLTIDEALNSPAISLTTKMALYTYLVDTATINGGKQVIARSENPGNLFQEHHSDIKGGITEITFAFGHELTKKIFLGGSLGIPIATVKRNTYYRETDASGDTDNDFRFMAYRENYKLAGAGFNLRIGAIYRPREYIRLGLALHSPDVLMLKESFDAGLAADVENLFAPNTGYDSVGAAELYGVPDFKYTLYTPGKIILSSSWVFREVENIKRQKGFISADIEYTNYRWIRFGADEEENADSKAFFKPYNDAIDAIYKSALNFRLGAEVKFNIIMARLGFAYYGSPYKDKELKAHKMNLSGGLGYRDKGFYVDLSYVHRLNKDVNFPYRVNAPRANTFSTIKETGGTVWLTLGCKI